MNIVEKLAYRLTVLSSSGVSLLIVASSSAARAPTSDKFILENVNVAPLSGERSMASRT